MTAAEEPTSERPKSERMNVGVVLERRRLDDPWRDHVWHAVEVVPGIADTGEWRKLADSEGAVRWLAPAPPIEMHRKDTEGYRTNIISGAPRVFVVLRPDPANPLGHEMRPFLATVCPFEAGCYSQSGEETVDTVPMPDEIRAWVEDFVERHHVEEPFVKRQRDRADPDKVGFGRRGPGERHG